MIVKAQRILCNRLMLTGVTLHLHTECCHNKRFVDKTMQDTRMAIRLTVRAAIVRDDNILLIECDKDTDLHYNYPGGGVDDNETLHEALHREVYEETTAHIIVRELLLEYEYVPAKEHYRYGDVHSVGLIYRCTLQPDSVPQMPVLPDAHQTGVKWVKISQLSEIVLLPDVTRRLLASLS